MAKEWRRTLQPSELHNGSSPSTPSHHHTPWAPELAVRRSIMVTLNGHLNGHITQQSLDKSRTLGVTLVSLPLYSLVFETGPQPVAGVLPYTRTRQGDRMKCVRACVCVCAHVHMCVQHMLCVCMYKYMPGK